MKKALLPGSVVLFAFAACNNEAVKPPPVGQPAQPTQATTEAPAKPATIAPSGISVGDELYIHAAKGAVLRKTPGKDGEKIATLVRNDNALTVLEVPDPANRYVAEKIGTFEVGGMWLKVASPDGDEGYIFSGYLSRHKPFMKESPEDMIREEAFYRTISPFKGERENIAIDERVAGGYLRHYEDGAVFELAHFTGGMDYSLTMPASVMTRQEALVIFRSLYFGKTDTKAAYDATTKRITVSGNEGYEVLTIEPKGNNLFVKVMSGD